MRDRRAPIVIIAPLMIVSPVVYFYNNIIYVCVYDTNYMTRLIDNSHVLAKTIFIYFFTSWLPPPPSFRQAKSIQDVHAPLYGYYFLLLLLLSSSMDTAEQNIIVIILCIKHMTNRIL